MRTRLLTLAVLGLLTIPAAVRAQGTTTTTPSGARREQAMERREAARARREAVVERREAMTPEQRDAARARRAERASAMPAEQRQFQTELRAYQRGLREKAIDLRSQVKAGTLTSDAMAMQLKAYREANRPTRPAATKPPTGSQ